MILVFLVESSPNKRKIIGKTKPRLRKNREVLSNIDLNDYSFEFATTQSTKGVVTLIYILNDLRYKIRKDLNLYREKEIESTFIEIIEPNVRIKTELLAAFTNIQTSQLLNLQVILLICF